MTVIGAMLSAAARWCGRVIDAIDPDEAVEAPAERPQSTLERVMLGREDLLWVKSTDDGLGPITMGLLQCPGGELGVLMDDCGEAIGLRLDRAEIQQLRDAITRHLVDTAEPVNR